MTPNCPWMWFCTESTSIFIARDGERSMRIGIISLLDAILQLEFKSFDWGLFVAIQLWYLWIVFVCVWVYVFFYHLYVYIYVY